MRFLIFLTVFILIAGCSEQQPIQRGFKYLGDGAKSQSDRASIESEAEHLERTTQTESALLELHEHEDELLVPSVEELRRDTDWYRFQDEPKQPLNLSLPSDWQWQDEGILTERQTFPNVFKLAPYENRFSVSGRLHLDESEEAEDLPPLELLQGAELELIFRTR